MHLIFALHNILHDYKYTINVQANKLLTVHFIIPVTSIDTENSDHIKPWDIILYLLGL